MASVLRRRTETVREPGEALDNGSLLPKDAVKAKKLCKDKVLLALEEDDFLFWICHGSILLLPRKNRLNPLRFNHKFRKLQQMH